MTDAEKIALVKQMSDEAADEVVSAYLFIAEQKICKRLFPASVATLPDGYDALQIEAAVYLMNKRGAEGQTSHSENGISRAYESGDLPDSLFIGYTAKAVVVS